ncbi:hypothetical protein BRADI_3g51095v3 [Brachypodium distachyon]|uniref:Uncharacterized protein n=1 Tax=Brachypodium distachyon TaxID=15368 RepID=A0A0Q3FM80_BRADI|nr:hypothetical protein BRADI_3g51095v3 [Brachypodium distachyon]
MKKVYLRHAACDGTQFKLILHYRPFYLATCQDCRLQPFLAFTYLMRVRKSQGAMDCNPDRNLASAHHHRHSPTLWLALSNPRHCIPSLLIQRSLSQRSREHGRNKTRWCS